MIARFYLKGKKVFKIIKDVAAVGCDDGRFVLVFNNGSILYVEHALLVSLIHG